MNYFFSVTLSKHVCDLPHIQTVRDLVYCRVINMAITGKKSKQEIYDILKPMSVAVLSTISKDTTPYAAVIYFMVDSELNFYFMAESDTKKSENLQRNNHAALTIVDRKSPRTVQASGTAKEIEDPEIYRNLMVKISEANAADTEFYWPPPISKIDSSGDLIIYQFTPTWLRFADFSESTKKSIFYQVIPDES